MLPYPVFQPSRFIAVSNYFQTQNSSQRDAYDQAEAELKDLEHEREQLKEEITKLKNDLKAKIKALPWYKSDKASLICSVTRPILELF